MTDTYEHLSGGAGRTRFFRSERYNAREWLGRVRPVLLVDGEARQIHDLSMNGIAYYVPTLEGCAQAGEAVHIELRLGDGVVHAGQGEVIRAEATSRGGKVALKLVSGFLDIPRVVALHDELALEHEFRREIAEDSELIPANYRRICGDLVHFLRRYRTLTERFETLVPSDATDASARREEFFHQVLPAFRKRWETLRTEANASIDAFHDDPDVRSAAKRYTEATVTPEFMTGAYWKRCYEKPLGYPGDFGIMNFLYNDIAVGDSIYQKLISQVGLEQPVAASVPPRMRALCGHIRDVVAGTEDRAARICSLGCGPAREVAVYLRETLPTNAVEFTLIDQDYEALSYAHSDIVRAAERWGGRARAECLFVSFAQFLKSYELFDRIKDHDLIYSAGLFDYLRTTQAQQLAAALYTGVKPGGRLVIGNMAGPSDGKWCIEYVLDWTLLYRTEEEMREIAALCPGAEVDVRPEETGYTYLLTLTKPA